MNKKIIVYGLIEMIVIIAIVVGYLWYKTKGYYDVVFVNNGEIIERVRVKKNDSVKVPKKVKKVGYDIKYYLDDKEYRLNSSVTKNIVIEVEYKKRKTETKVDTTDEKEVYTITFDTQGGSEINNIKVEEGKKIKMPEDPTRDGYEFVEWQLDGTKFDSNSKINKDITLVAVWKEVAKQEQQPEQQPQSQPTPTPTPQPTPQPQPQPTPQPVAKSYTFSYSPVDLASPEAFIYLYENGKQIGFSSIRFTDGISVPYSNGTVPMNEIENESALVFVLNDGSVVTANR